MKKAKVKYSSVDELMADEGFRSWVLQNDKDLNYFWVNWMNSYPDKKAMVLEAREMLLSIKFQLMKAAVQDEEQVLTKVLQEKYSHRHDAMQYDIQTYHSYRNRQERLRWYSAAAVLAFISMSIVFLFYKHQSVEVQNEAVVQWVLKENPKDQRSSLKLPDGSIVVLNINSSVNYPVSFDADVRLIEISGEAYIDVVKDIHKPFVVKTKNMVTTALGTSFNVRAVDNENDEEIALVSGKVKVEYTDGANRSEDILEPGQLLHLNKLNKNVNKAVFNPEAIVGWKDGVLLFENDSYKEVVRKIERWYGVKVHLHNKPAESWEINGRFVNNSLYDLLSSLKYTHGIQFKIFRNDKVELKF